MAAPVLTYIRSKHYVENTYERKATPTSEGEKRTAHGLVGELWVKGQMFETLERMDGYVCLRGDRRYPYSAMYWHRRLGYVINPWHHIKNKYGKHAEILVHRGKVPSHFKGCIGVGFFEGKALTMSDDAMHAIWKLCGGRIGDKRKKPPLVVTLRVKGHMPRLKDCTPYAPLR